MYKNKEDYQAYQEKWRRDHPTYFKQYYLDLKAGRKRPTIFSRIREVTSAFFRNLVKGGKK